MVKILNYKIMNFRKLAFGLIPMFLFVYACGGGSSSSTTTTTPGSVVSNDVISAKFKAGEQDQTMNVTTAMISSANNFNANESDFFKYIARNLVLPTSNQTVIPGETDSAVTSANGKISGDQLKFSLFKKYDVSANGSITKGKFAKLGTYLYGKRAGGEDPYTFKKQEGFLYDVNVVKLKYNSKYPGIVTSYSDGKTTKVKVIKEKSDIVASALLVYPKKAGKYPVINYNHASTDDVIELPTFIGKDSKGSLAYASSTARLAMQLAGLGFIVVVPDYLGLSGSFYQDGSKPDPNKPHPYLYFDALADDVLYAIKASNDYLNGLGSDVKSNNQVFSIGDSQGGVISTFLAAKNKETALGKLVRSFNLGGPVALNLLFERMMHTKTAYGRDQSNANIKLEDQLSYAGNATLALKGIVGVEFGGVANYKKAGASIQSNLDSRIQTLLTDAITTPVETRLINTATETKTKQKLGNLFAQGLNSTSTVANLISKLVGKSAGDFNVSDKFKEYEKTLETPATDLRLATFVGAQGTSSFAKLFLFKGTTVRKGTSINDAVKYFNDMIGNDYYYEVGYEHDLKNNFKTYKTDKEYLTSVFGSSFDVSKATAKHTALAKLNTDGKVPAVIKVFANVIRNNSLAIGGRNFTTNGVSIVKKKFSKFESPVTLFSGKQDKFVIALSNGKIGESFATGDSNVTFEECVYNTGRDQDDDVKASYRAAAVPASAQFANHEQCMRAGKARFIRDIIVKEVDATTQMSLWGEK